MRVACIYDVEGWAHYGRCVALRQHAPNDIVMELYSLGQIDDVLSQEYDIILLLPGYMTRKVRESLTVLESNTQLVAGYNVGWAHGKDILPMLMKYSDHVVINNWESWHRNGRLPGTSCISNGVDQETFSIKQPIADRPRKVIWTGSRYHLRHNNDLKGYRLLRAIESRLREAHIAYEWRLVDSVGKRKWSPQQMAEWYNGAQVYVCASRTEGTPNPLLEAAACGCVPCSTRVGNALEIIRPGVNGELVDRTADELYAGIVRCIEWYAEMAPTILDDIQAWSWGLHSQAYYALFRRLLRRRGERTTSVIPGTS